MDVSMDVKLYHRFANRPQMVLRVLFIDHLTIAAGISKNGDLE